jgi:2-polyprenyl-3-methyl-5-hydroxy-6-metoxy-1,4-benzoquinol methylase
MIYQNAGNKVVVRMVAADARHILDVGCGAGDNARLLLAGNPKRQIVGITLSQEEAAVARNQMIDIYVADVENADLPFAKSSFDTIICSHVLEHLRDPVAVIRRLLPFLVDNGQIIIAVPNVLEFRNRLRLLLGKFQYQEQGIMDRTHLRFFTWYTVVAELIEPIRELQVENKTAEGGVPLAWARQFLLPAGASKWLDEWATRQFPNLFAWQVVISVRVRK